MSFPSCLMNTLEPLIHMNSLVPNSGIHCTMSKRKQKFQTVTCLFCIYYSFLQYQYCCMVFYRKYFLNVQGIYPMKVLRSTQYVHHRLLIFVLQYFQMEHRRTHGFMHVCSRFCIENMNTNFQWCVKSE